MNEATIEKQLIAENVKRLFERRRRMLGLHTRKRLKRPPAMLYPAMLENKHARDLRSVVDKWKQQVKMVLFPMLVQEFGGVKQTRHDAKPKIKEFVSVIDLMSFDNALITAIPTITTNALNVANWNQQKWQKVVSSVMGVTVATPVKGIDVAMEDFVERNVALLKDTSQQVKTQIKLVIADGLKKGWTADRIASKILSGTDLERGVFKKAETRATLIARQQVGQYTSWMNQKRQTALGVNKYRWRGMLDQRERPEHRAREGQVFSWDRPPEDGHPGEPYNCRCYPEAIFDDIEAEAGFW